MDVQCGPHEETISASQSLPRLRSTAAATGLHETTLPAKNFPPLISACALSFLSQNLSISARDMISPKHPSSTNVKVKFRKGQPGKLQFGLRQSSISCCTPVRVFSFSLSPKTFLSVRARELSLSFFMLLIIFHSDLICVCDFNFEKKVFFDQLTTPNAQLKDSTTGKSARFLSLHMFWYYINIEATSFVHYCLCMLLAVNQLAQ